MRRAGIRPPRRAALGAALTVFAALAVLVPPARAEWMQPDASYRDAQMMLRSARRDTVGYPNDVGRQDTLGVALLRLGRSDEAERVFRRVLELAPGDDTAEAALGKLALFANRLAEAESLLAAAGEAEGAVQDLYAAKLRRGDWAGASTLVDRAGDVGRLSLLESLAEEPPFTIEAGPDRGRVLFTRAWPVPLVAVKLNGQNVLMAVDVGASDVLVDPIAVRRYGVRPLTGQRSVLWNGARVAVGSAIVPRLEIAGFRIARVPAGVIGLRKYGLLVNPQAPPIAGVIGSNLLRRFGCTLDFREKRLELSRAPASEIAGAVVVPYEMWGEAEMMVKGSLNGGRPMGLMVATGMPECGIGAPLEVFEEVGVKPGSVARLVKGAGVFLQGHPWVQVVVPTITVGALAHDKVKGWSGAFDPSELWRHGVRRDGLLGPDFFSDRRVTFDWAGRRLLVEGEN